MRFGKNSGRPVKINTTSCNHMKIVIPLAIAAVIAFLVFSLQKGKGLIRGVADGLLVSPARPAVAVVPLGDFRLLDAARAVLSPEVSGSATQNSSVHTVYALYGGQAKPDEYARTPALLLAVLAVNDTERTEWPIQPTLPVKPFRQREIVVAGREGEASTFVLPEGKNPWRLEAYASSDADRAGQIAAASGSRNPGQIPGLAIWSGDCLVRRFDFQYRIHGARLFVEYREPVPSTGKTGQYLPIEDNLPYLAGFEQRAAEAFSLREGKELPRPTARLPYPPKSFGQREMTRYLGELRWNGVR